MSEKEAAQEALIPYRKFISERPGLVSLLYDIDMMPEQTVTMAGATRLSALCAVWKAGEDGTLPVVTPFPPEPKS